MVVQFSNVIRYAVSALCIALLLIASANADVLAKVDRPSVDLNESFLLEIIVDSNIELEPDLSVLDKDFYRGQLSQLSNTTIINGQIRRSRTWSIPLMARATGQQVIPAIIIGNEQSDPIVVIVSEPSNAPPGEADVFVTSEVDQPETFVQAQILYRFKVYRSVATRQEGRRDPTFSGAEVLVERAGEERSYEAILNGKAYSVVERVLAIYPQASGEITISPALFEARVLRDGRITGRKVFESEPHTINVLPIPAPPDGFPDAAWLPARDVRLTEEWSREPDRIAAGEPLTRKITISALGQIETQLPAIEPPTIDGMNVYADKADLSRQFELEGIRGVRRDQYAMIGVRGGMIEIPELELPWWDIDAGEWRIARLGSRVVEVKSAQIAVAEPPPAAVDQGEGATEKKVSAVADDFWKRVSQLIAAVWALTVVAWWWTSRDTERAPRTPTPPPVYKQQAKIEKAAKKAAVAGDLAAVRAALIEWGRLEWPHDPPRSIGEFANRVAPPLSDELQTLSTISYGAAGGDWDGSALARALRSIKAREDEEELVSHDILPPLMPPGA